MPKYNKITDIGKILNEYSYAIQDEIVETAQLLANQAAKELRITSPKRKTNGGKYAKGWRVKVKTGNGYVNCIVYNATNWQLTHLLENGHMKRNGRGRVKPIVHIKPVETKYVNKYTKNVEKIIKNGGYNA